MSAHFSDESRDPPKATQLWMGMVRIHCSMEPLTLRKFPLRMNSYRSLTSPGLSYPMIQLSCCLLQNAFPDQPRMIALAPELMVQPCPNHQPPATACCFGQIQMMFHNKMSLSRLTRNLRNIHSICTSLGLCHPLLLPTQGRIKGSNV